MDRLGACDFNGSTDRDCTVLYMTVPEQSLDAALWIESERMGYLFNSLTDAALHSARRGVLNELKRNESAPGAALEAAITDAAFPTGHPYSHLPGGDPRDLEAISLANKQWLSDHYKPNNATLVVSGDVDLETVRRRVENTLGLYPDYKLGKTNHVVDSVHRERCAGQFPLAGRKIHLQVVRFHS